MAKSISFSSSDPKPYVSFAVSLLSKENFLAKTPVPGQIVFLEEENLIYFDGEFYGITNDQAATLSDVASRITTLETEVGHQSTEMTTLNQQLAAAILALKNNQGNWGTQGISGKTITEAITGIQSQVNGLTTGVSSVNTQTGAVVLSGSDILVGNQGTSGMQSDTIGQAISKKVTINTSTSAGANSGVTPASLTDTAAIATAIENAHTAAVGAQGVADTKISKSDGAQAVTATGAASGAQSITGITPASLQDGEDIAQAIEDTAATLIGTSNVDTWANETKTLGALRDLISSLSNSVSELSGVDTTTLNKITAIIQELNQTSEGSDLASTVIDKLWPLLNYAETYSSAGGAQGAQGYYRVGQAGATGTEYKATLQEIIDAIEADIQVASGAGVTQLTGAQGVNVSNNGVGSVTVTATSDALTTAALTQTGGYGATTASGSTVQTALQDVNTAAAGAHTAAAAAQGDADTALGQLTWNIIS